MSNPNPNSGSTVIAFLAALELILLVASTPIFALSEKPRAPCGAEPPFPNYPALEASPEIKLWTASELGDGWSPPACTPWQGQSATLVVGLAGHFQDAADADEILARIGAISSLRDVRYWSVTDKNWNALFTRATALDGPDPSKPRRDFSAGEMRAGHDLYFLTADNRSQGDAVSRLRVSTVESGRLVIETTNVTPVRWMFLTFAAPGDVQTWYFLEQATARSWRFYSLTRVRHAASFGADFIPNASYINRALAMYRHFVQIPTDRDPPAVP